MTILTRFFRILRADIHGILDSMEEPEVILRQSIRDMQEEIEQANHSIASLATQEENLLNSRQGYQNRIQQLEDQLQLCLNEGNDILAKSVIKKRLQCESLLKHIHRQLQTVNEAKGSLINETHERMEKLQAIQDKLSLFTSPQFDSEATSEGEEIISQDEVEVIFLREKKRYSDTVNSGGRS